jgi:hypothetical protein
LGVQGQAAPAIWTAVRSAYGGDFGFVGRFHACEGVAIVVGWHLMGSMTLVSLFLHIFGFLIRK